MNQEEKTKEKFESSDLAETESFTQAIASRDNIISKRDETIKILKKQIGDQQRTISSQMEVIEKEKAGRIDAESQLAEKKDLKVEHKGKYFKTEEEKGGCFLRVRKRFDLLNRFLLSKNMTILESNQPQNLENEFLKGLRNRTVVGDIQNQTIVQSKILPHIKVLNIPGDVLKIVGLKSNRPRKFTWDYDQKKFGPGDAVIHKAEITDDDKLIFYTVFSEPIEKIAVGEKSAETIAKQADQVAYDIADFYDEEFVQNYACDLNRYYEGAIVELNTDQLRDTQLVGEIAVTVGYQMTSPSTMFNKRRERCNVRDTKQILCFIDYSLYGRGKMASIYTTPSPVLKELENTFTVIPCSMTNNVKLSLIDDPQKYLKLLEKTFSSFVELDSGEIKKNEEEFFKKLSNELKKFDETKVKEGLKTLLTKINPGEDDANKKQRFAKIIESLKDKNLVEEEQTEAE
ncbi:8406_t:CDS:2 [Ambispora leptoticha]|uniref:8406_t:CDS:1 n=1 Tax=Ambispora leptoticha TaxID=144679 RepID=A0A9N8YLW4_9GLOM|nr:8406_t:CDS:2 [Ambispora leptoticha]